MILRTYLQLERILARPMIQAVPWIAIDFFAQTARTRMLGQTYVSCCTADSMAQRSIVRRIKSNKTVTAAAPYQHRLGVAHSGSTHTSTPRVIFALYSLSTRLAAVAWTRAGVYLAVEEHTIGLQAKDVTAGSSAPPLPPSLCACHPPFPSSLRLYARAVSYARRTCALARLLCEYSWRFSIATLVRPFLHLRSASSSVRLLSPRSKRL
eukprot:364604-Chlamydomonas_euryale.AAC.18